MILQIEIKEWIILQDALAGIRMRHSYEDIKALAAKLDKAFNEQCIKPKEGSNDNKKTVSI